MATAKRSQRDMFAIILLTFCLTPLVHSQCQIPPLGLSWGNTTVTQDGIGVTRGIAMGIGSPQQIFALRPYTQLNNTRVNNIADCTSASNDTCIGAQGGVFNSANSDTYAVTIKGNWNGSQVDAESSTGAYVYFNDKMTYQSQNSTRGFPFVMNSEPAGGSFSGLPIGSNSSFLAATVKGGAAPSEVVGLWTGSRSLAPVDGLLVVGGYDAARVKGNFNSYNTSLGTKALPCPLQVNVTGLTFAGRPMLNSSDSFVACIEPYVQRFVFPPAVARAFASITNQQPSAYPTALQYSANDIPVGDLELTFSDGYKSTITNRELFTVLRGSDQYGRYSITNTSAVEAGIADSRKQTVEKTQNVLGGLFLTFNYLLVDHKKNNFSLAPAVDASVTTQEKLQTVCTPTAAASSTAAPSHTGAIVGGVVGGVVGALAIAGAIIAYFIIRRRKRRREEEAAAAAAVPPPVPEKETDDPHNYMMQHRPSELDSPAYSAATQSPRGTNAVPNFTPLAWSKSHEMQGDNAKFHELPTHNTVAEMEAPYPPHYGGK